MISYPRVALLLMITMCCCGRESAPPPDMPPKSPAAPLQAAPPAASTAIEVDSGPPSGAGVAPLTFKAVALPGVSAKAAVDFIAYEPGRERVWVPVANTGSVDVFGIAAGTFARINGFATTEVENKGSKRMLGPSAISIGEGFAYVSNRATREVCPVSTTTLRIGKCLKLPSAPDGVAYVASGVVPRSAES